MKKIITFIVPAFILSSLFLCSLTPIRDFDFWWHLKTGEYIIETGQLPDTDPFSFTMAGIDRDSPWRPLFILKSYWLGQAATALVVNSFGFKGFIVMRAMIFALIALIVFTIQGLLSPAGGRAPEAAGFRVSNFGPGTPPNSELRTPGYSSLHAVRCALLFMLALVTTECLTDRPQMFSFLFAILLIFLFESYRLRATRFTLYAIPVLMLLWAQMHAGYIVGIAYLLVYLITLPLEGRGTGRPRAARPALPASIIILSILITYLNPTHWQGISAVLYAHGGSTLHGQTLEFLSPVELIPLAKKSPGWLSYWALIGLSVAAAVRFLRERSWSRLIMLSGAVVASLVSMRYVYFFAPLAVATLPAAFAGSRLQVRGDRHEKLPAFLMVLPLVFAIAFTYHKVNFRGLLKAETSRGLFPEQAAKYILSRGIPQPIFNDITWGGFLIYRLWPEYKVFADTRTLNIDIYRQYMNVLNYTAEGGAILRAYGIKSIITPAINPYTGEMFPLVRGLAGSDDWDLVYLDGIAMIFVRKGYATQTLPKAAVYEEVLREAMFRAPLFPDVPGYQRTLDEVRKALEGGGRVP